LVKSFAVTFRHTGWPLITLLALPIVKASGEGVPPPPAKATVPPIPLRGTDISAVLISSIGVGALAKETCVVPVPVSAVKHKVNTLVPLAKVSPLRSGSSQETVKVPGLVRPAPPATGKPNVPTVNPGNPKLLTETNCNAAGL